ncbi:binding-protein-dependent transport systems inner membrane component [Dictyoglomus turgidum DSM 6724]|uniref:Binding-protein-dependent transport systems inner membrane component n=1 Tax=Dictyoglomus turgidum (strain DSM 6724 / Z-1310) TaxID=515635 RepID=B8DYP0_DICTD|nr:MULTISPECIES: ABC transporter permease [Dictyoglomus]ACK41422.1 binding-protein-dependent transport systems inner membrane component [Dictyoglomus turgidum DSM 6724]HBU31573.1 ABC transporter permease [Dictyoglomus sp.]
MRKLIGLFYDLLKDYRFTISFIIFLFLIILAILSFFSPYNPQRTYQVPSGLPPSKNHILGTNWLGQDVFWQLTFAVKNSLTIAIVTAFFSRIIAVIVGIFAGYKGGKTDRILITVGDTTMVLPFLIILIIISMILKDWTNNFFNLGLLLAFFSWAWDARVIRSQILSLRERDFIKVAVLSGMPTMRIVRKQLLPHVLPIIFTTFINNMSWAIGMEITLAYLGLGIDPTIPTIGTMLQTAIYRQALFMGLWWWLATPIVTAILLFIALYWLSVSLSEYLDPRARFQRVGA